MAKMTPQSFLEIAGLPVTTASVRKLTESVITEAPGVQTWEIDRIPGGGRGSSFFNADDQFTDPETGIVVTGWEGYDNDEDWDDFGHEFYSCTVQGTKRQVNRFIDNESDGDRSGVTVRSTSGKNSRERQAKIAQYILKNVKPDDQTSKQVITNDQFGCYVRGFYANGADQEMLNRVNQELQRQLPQSTAILQNNPVWNSERTKMSDAMTIKINIA